MTVIHMRVIAIMNNKGGVGKTVTAINLADILVHDYKKRVILVDCDGQMNLTRFFLPEFDPEINYNMVSLLMEDGEPLWRDNLMPLSPNLDLLPSSADLYDLDLDAIQKGEKAMARVAEFVAAVREDDGADYLIFDCPTGYTVASVGALMAADEAVIPAMLDGFSCTGIEDMQKQIANLKRNNYGLRIAGVLLTQWHNSPVVHRMEQMVRESGIPVFRQTIRRTDKVPESTGELIPVSRFSPKSAASVDYRKWVREYLGEG